MEKIIVINQKMYFNSLSEITKFQDDLNIYKDKIIVLPSYLYIENFISKGYKVGSQNVSDEISGAHTGEVSAESLKDLGVLYTLIGHKEVREKYSEDIQKKINLALQKNLKVILCIGENKGEDPKKHIKSELENLNLNQNVIISYEPNWAIGSNITPSVNDIEDISNYIKSLTGLKVLYGGSVNEENINDLSKLNLDGFLIGSKSKDSSSLKKIIEVSLK